jgi:hypothetical protein
MMHTTKIQVVESLHQTKVPAVIAGSTIATSFTAQDAASWAGAVLSIMICGQVAANIWAKVDGIIEKRRARKIAEREPLD